MLSKMSNLRDVPKPVQAAGLIAGGAGITAIVFMAPRFAIALFIGLVVVGAALLLYRRVLKWKSRRKSAPMEEVALMSGAPPLRKADEKVKIDNLRRRFEDGINKFREAGKSLYSLPWFIIVGEPGSGKTEAIRHCNVGFPPGLQDEYQGIGGTINMNWWFTNHGIIIDTAGRLMFEDVEGGGTREWKEFLNLLKKYRPYCPTNGVFLVIPADSLVKDSAEQIQEKASKIAQQFNVIQRTLAVRFPVFVVVTKCDLVMGFREFFDGLNNPDLQHQILGWSNPAKIDQPYDRDFVRQHLESVQERLHRRRLSLLLELADDETAQESASVNALYSFPKSLAQLAPRMTQYLDLIFGGSEWGAKPVFFRGIYFTSSMQEGAALDEDLAQALGISVESLPEGPAWTRDRAFFLRDLFLKKVFPEKGLVTSALNATKQYVRRRMAFWLSVAAAVFFLLIYTIYAEHRFNGTVGRVDSYVSKAAKATVDDSLDMVGFEEVPTILWDEEDMLDLKGRKEAARYQFCGNFKTVIDDWDSEGETWLLLPLTKLFKIDSAQMRLALKSVFEDSVLRPFYEETCELLASPPSAPNWEIDSSELRVLAQLIKVRCGRPLDSNSTSGEYTADRFIDPFWQCWRDRASRPNISDPSASLKAVLKDLYAPDTEKGAFPWPGSFLAEDSPLKTKTDPHIASAIGRFINYWDPNAVIDRSDVVLNLDILLNLAGTLRTFDTAEQDLLKLANAANFTDAQFNEEWTGRYERLAQAKMSLEKLDVGTLEKGYGEHWHVRLIDELSAQAEKSYLYLLDAFPEIPPDPCLADLRTMLEAERGVWREGLALILKSKGLGPDGLVARLWTKRANGRPYAIRFSMYETAEKDFRRARRSDISFHKAPGKIKAIEALNEVARQSENAVSIVISRFEDAPDPNRQAGTLCNRALDLAKKEHISHIMRAALDTAPKSVRELEDMIQNSVSRAEDLADTAKTYLNDWAVFSEYAKNDSALSGRCDEKARIYEGYVRDYWLGRYLVNWIKDNTPRESSWANQHAEISLLDYSRTRDDLKALGDTVDGVVSMIFPEGSQEQTVLAFRESRSILNRIGRDDPYRDVLARWTVLEKNSPYAAQYALLNKRPSDFLDEHFPGNPSDLPSRFVESYWWTLSLETLKILAGTEPGMSPEVELFLTYYKYPLDASGVEELTPSQFDEAEESWEAIGKGPVYAAGSIGEQPHTGNKLIDEWLVRLKNNNVLSSSPPDKDKIAARISLISRIRRSYDLELSVYAEGNEALFKVLQYVELEGDNLTSAKIRPTVDPSDNMHLADIHWPGGVFRFNFYGLTTDQLLHSYPSRYKGQWVSMRIFDDASADSRFLIRCPIKYKDRDYTITLAVKPVEKSGVLRP